MTEAPPEDPVLHGRVQASTGRGLWRARVAATPERPFLICGDRRWTFGEADVAMRALAAGLAGIGIEPGMRVAVGLVNSDEALLVHAALRELAAVIVPLVPGLTEPELGFMLSHSGASALVVDEPLAAVFDRLPDMPPGVRTIIRGDAGELEALRRSEPSAPPAVVDDDISAWAIFYTSGSTGRPKGVVLPAGAFVSAGAGYADRFALTQEDNYILPTPMAHAVGGLTAQAMALYTGCRLTIVDRFSPSVFWGQVQDAEATVSVLFPAHLNLLMELAGDGPAAGESSLRLAITHAWHERFRARFGVELALCWGMTETGAASTGGLPGERGEQAGYVGWGMHDVELAICDREIHLRHRHRMLGYLDDPAATAATITPDGWVRSGDTGALAGDGRLFYGGRIKNMIKRSGENISPEELENALTEHPQVAEALVLGVTDALRTEEVAAVVVLAPGQSPSPADLLEFLSDRLARFKLPRYVWLSDQALPRLPAGKVDRSAVVARFDLGRCWDRHRHGNGPSKP